MDGYTLADLRTYLRSVRGESRIKNREDSIRDIFIQSACTEVFAEFDWVFNKRTVTLTLGQDNTYSAPKDFSILNTFSARGVKTYSSDDGTLSYSFSKGKTKITGPTEQSISLTYYIKAPKFDDQTVTGVDIMVYFPQPIILAERAFVRLKAAYFPDESSDKELQRSKMAVRELFTNNQVHLPFRRGA